MNKLIILTTALIFASAPVQAYTSTRTSSSSSNLATGMAVGMAFGMAVNSNRSHSTGMMVGECPNPDLAIVMQCYGKEMGVKGVWAYRGCKGGTISETFGKVSPPLAAGLHWEVRAVFDSSKNSWLITGCGIPDAKEQN